MKSQVFRRGGQAWDFVAYGGESAFEVFPEGVGEFGAEFVDHAAGAALDLFNEAVQVVARAGDGDDADGGGLPGDRIIHLCNGDVEALLQLILERAHHLTPVLERLGVLDSDFESQMRDGHGLAGIYRDSVSLF